MVNFSLRAAEQTDFPAIQALIRLAHINPTALNWQRFIIARDSQGNLVGCGQVKPHRDVSKELASIAVTPGWRGQGVARAIIEQLIANNPGDLYLTCRESLGPFYQRFGFQVVKADAMTPYFRRISRMGELLLKLGTFHEGLLVMKRERQARAGDS